MSMSTSGATRSFISEADDEQAGPDERQDAEPLGGLAEQIVGQLVGAPGTGRAMSAGCWAVASPAVRHRSSGAFQMWRKA